MKVKNVMERVYNPGRLRSAWKQIRKNAGTEGIDEMTVEQFQENEEY